MALASVPTAMASEDRCHRDPLSAILSSIFGCQSDAAQSSGSTAQASVDVLTPPASQSGKATTHVPVGQQIAEQVVSQVGVKAAFFFGGPVWGYPVCTGVTYTQMLVNKDRHNEQWLPLDYPGKLLLSGYRCSPLGFIEVMINGGNPFDIGLAAAGGAVGFNAIQGNPATAITLVQTYKPVWDNLPQNKHKKNEK